MSPTLLLALLAATPLDAGALPTPSIQAAPADAPTVTVRTDKTQAHVGDAITFTITSIGPRTMPVVLPVNLELSPFSELSRNLEEKDLGDGKMSRQFNLSVAAYEPGSFEIPSVELTYFSHDGNVRSLHTQALPLVITSLLANEAEPKLKDNADSLPVVQRDYLAVYIAGYLVNLSALVLFVDVIGFAHEVVQAVMVFVVAALTFLLQKYWVFRASGQPTERRT